MGARRRFDHDPVSHAVAHYLVSIAELHEEYGYARVSDVARRVGITRGSASITLKNLKQKGFVLEDENRFLRLSPTGEEVASAVRAKKALMRELFIELLDVSPEQAETDTCQIEHLISAETAGKMARLLDYVKTDDETVRAFLRAARTEGKPQRTGTPSSGS